MHDSGHNWVLCRTVIVELGTSGGATESAFCYRLLFEANGSRDPG